MSRILALALVVTLALVVGAAAAEAGPTTPVAAPPTATPTPTVTPRAAPTVAAPMTAARTTFAPPGGTGRCGCGEGAYPWYRCRPACAVQPCAPNQWRARYYVPSCYDARWYGPRCRRFQANGWRRGTGPTRR